MRPRDSQRTKVYRWETANLTRLDTQDPRWSQSGYPLDKQRLTLEEATELVAEACLLFGVKPPIVEAKHHGMATGGPSVIRLPSWALTRRVVLHEVAHTIKARIEEGLPQDTPAHGPVFVRILFELVCHFYKSAVKPADLRKTLTAAKIKMGPAGVAARLTRAERATWRQAQAKMAAIAKRRADLSVLMRKVNEDEQSIHEVFRNIRTRVSVARAEAATQARVTRERKASQARQRWFRMQQAAKAQTHDDTSPDRVG